MEDKIITFQSYYDPMLAEIIKARLEANGIDCFIADELIIGTNPLFNNTVGGVKLKIFERDIEKCKAILATPEELELDNNEDVDGDTICPYCGSTNVRYGSATERKTTILGAIISFLFMAYPFIARKAWHCFNCGRDFE